MLAARSLGMTKWQSIRTVILPQALRLSLPGWSNEYPVLLTDSAVAYVIGVAELLTRTAQVISKTGEPMVLYLTVLKTSPNPMAIWRFSSRYRLMSIKARPRRLSAPRVRERVLFCAVSIS